MRIFQIVCLIFFTGFTPAPATGQPATEDAMRGHLRSLADFHALSCRRGNLESCIPLGWAYQLGAGRAKNLYEARRLYQQACDGGVQKGCVQIGMMYQTGHGVTQNEDQAVDIFRSACDADEGLGCTRYAQYLQRQPADLERILTLYEQACVLEDPEGCAILGYYHQGTGFDLGGEYIRPELDPMKATYYFGRACEKIIFLQSTPYQACMYAAQPVFYPLQITPEQVVIFLTRGCNHWESSSCRILGDYYANGRYVKQDLNLALHWYKRGCDHGLASACEHYALLDLENPNDPRGTYGATEEHRTRMRGLYELAQARCADDQKCRMLARYYEYGLEVERDLAEALRLYENDCFQRFKNESCADLSTLLLQESILDERLEDAMLHLGKGCLEGIQSSCDLVAPLWDQLMAQPD